MIFILIASFLFPSIHKAGHIFIGPSSNVKNIHAHTRVWAWFSSSGSGALRRVEGTTSDDYTVLVRLWNRPREHLG